jgi:hypothetical protein
MIQRLLSLNFTRKDRVHVSGDSMEFSSSIPAANALSSQVNPMHEVHRQLTDTWKILFGMVGVTFFFPRDKKEILIKMTTVLGPSRTNTHHKTLIDMQNHTP